MHNETSDMAAEPSDKHPTSKCLMYICLTLHTALASAPSCRTLPVATGQAYGDRTLQVQSRPPLASGANRTAEMHNAHNTSHISQMTHHIPPAAERVRFVFREDQFINEYVPAAVTLK